MPSRIGLMRPTLETLLQGNRVPDRIRIILPLKPLRESGEFTIPDFLADEKFHRGLVEIVSIERDFGPGSKLLGTVAALTEPTCLILADDDVRYRSDFVEGLAEAQLANRSASFSYFTYPVGGIDVGQGCDGFSFWTPNLEGIEAFFADYVDCTRLMFHDDLWISFFLAARRIKLNSLGHRLDASTIYEQVHEVNALKALEGSLDREDINVREYRDLISRVRMSISRRLAIRAKEYSRCLASPLQRLQAKIKRRPRA